MYLRPLKHIRVRPCVGVTCMSQKSPQEPIIDPPEEQTILPFQYENAKKDLNTLRSRLVYQSRKRGMLENGLILSTFAAKYIPTMTEEQLGLYDRLINTPSNDWDLYYWAIGMKVTPKAFDNEVMTMLKEHVKGPNKLGLMTQPPLY